MTEYQESGPDIDSEMKPSKKTIDQLLRSRQSRGIAFIAVLRDFLRIVSSALKYLSIAIALLGYQASAFCLFLSPRVSYWLLFACMFCWFLVFAYSVVALIRWRRTEFIAYAMIWAWLFLAQAPPYGQASPPPYMRLSPDWLFRAGFKIHIFPEQNYLRRCEAKEFFENGLKQSFGICEWIDFDYETIFYAVYYDTTGEIAVSPSRHTDEWTNAIKGRVPSVVEHSKTHIYHLTGNFYLATLNGGEVD